MNKIKKGDKVIVLAGKDRGRTGTVKGVSADSVVVDGVNICKKHVKPNPHLNVQGGIVERELSIHLSNIALLNPATNKADKVGFKTIDAKKPGEKAKKVRYFKSNNELVDAVV